MSKIFDWVASTFLIIPKTIDPNRLSRNSFVFFHLDPSLNLLVPYRGASVRVAHEEGPQQRKEAYGSSHCKAHPGDHPPPHGPEPRSGWLMLLDKDTCVNMA